MFYFGERTEKKEADRLGQLGISGDIGFALLLQYMLQDKALYHPHEIYRLYIVNLFSFGFSSRHFVIESPHTRKDHTGSGLVADKTHS